MSRRGTLPSGACEVRIAALGDPTSDAARWARSQWSGEVESLSTDGAGAAADRLPCSERVLSVDLNILSRRSFRDLCEEAVVCVACDLPSGVESDSGNQLSEVPAFDMTVTFGALKPAHRLYPAMGKCGRVVLGEIGIAAEADWHEIATPRLPPLDPGGHKYDRGLVHALAGKMPGAIALAAKAAAFAGAGYVRVSTSRPIDELPAAVVQIDTAEVNDDRIGCLLVGPGMGDIPQLLTLALTSQGPEGDRRRRDLAARRSGAAQRPGFDRHAA